MMITRRNALAGAAALTLAGRSLPARSEASSIVVGTWGGDYGALLQQKDQFVKAVTSKLMLYALGRELDYHDAPAIRAIARSTAARHG